MPRRFMLFFLMLMVLNGLSFVCVAQAAPVTIPDTGQDWCFDNTKIIACPSPGEPFFGQDAQYAGSAPAYRDNGDGTVTDLNTGLMWSKALDEKKVSLIEAQEIARKMTLAGYNDWRVPNIKELYSLIDFRGCTGSPGGDMYTIPRTSIPYINTDYFDFRYGKVDQGERFIDGQCLSSTRYVSTTMDRAKTLFGVNFVDGRIKGYGYSMPHSPRPEKKFYARYVRGNPYGFNDFKDNGNGTVTDRATGMMWEQKDSGKALSWKDSLAYCEDLTLAGYNDWRLPNAKELQYIVDYLRSPDTTDSPAIDPVFQTTSIINEAGQKDFPYFWTSTTHMERPGSGAAGAYVSFGRAMGKIHGEVMDVHGAGAQRSDPKTGRPTSRGPQGDMRRIKNYVRCVRGGNVVLKNPSGSRDKNTYPEDYTPPVIASSSGPMDQGRPGMNQMPGQGGASQGMSRPGFVARLDRNGDGKVSRSEFDGPPQQFDVLDKNHDGYLTEDEAPPFPPGQGRGQRGMAPPQGF